MSGLFVDSPPGSPYEEPQGEAAQIGENTYTEVDGAPRILETEESLSSQRQDMIEMASRIRDSEMVPKLSLLGYESTIVHEMLLEDQLAVIGCGLGLHTVAAALTMLVDVAGTSRSVTCPLPIGKESLVLIVGASLEDCEYLEDELRSLQVPDLVSRGVQVLTSTTDSSKRAVSYASGGVYAVTSRILVVDMLNGNIDISKITGIIVLNAERVSDTSSEAFILKLFRAKNQLGFIKAFSDRPEAISRGINGLSARLQSLGLPRVSLWPRFRLEVADCLAKCPVNEILLEMSPSMIACQMVLQELFQVCLSEIKYRTQGIDNEGWTVDAALSGDLFTQIRRGLDSSWHRLSSTCRQAVHELRSLQGLLHGLANQDPVRFQLQVNEMWLDQRPNEPSPLLELEAARVLRQTAKERVLQREELPKWYHLSGIMVEYAAKKPKMLILCGDAYTKSQIQGYLDYGENYVAHLVEVKNMYEQSLRDRDFEQSLEPSPAPEPKRVQDPRRAKRRRVRGTMRAMEERAKPPTTIEEFTAEAMLPVEVQRAPPVPGLHPRVATFDEARILWKHRPDVVIMYEHNLEFTRNLEVYETSSGARPDVFVMYYQRSVEELHYLSRLRREKDAFSKLIHEKGTMPMVLVDSEDRAAEIDGPRVISTRIGGRLQQRVVSQKPRVVVDTREFNASLPFLLWKAHMDVIPLTLTVGDYVLSPSIVVERKSVTDLEASFKDGRLIDQCKAMFKHYRTPMLLIEFDNEKSFSLEPFAEIRSATTRQQSELIANLAMLLQKFPKLKLIWSISPRHTSEIFAAIKTTAEEPDPAQCAAAGRQVVNNETALAMLLAIPGVTAVNKDVIMSRVKSLRELVELGVKELEPIVGKEAAVKMVRFMREGEQTKGESLELD